VSWQSQPVSRWVVSDLGSLPELAYDSTFVFEAANPRALAETILRHLDDRADVRGAALRHAQARFSWDRAAELSTELHGELAARSGSSPRRHDPARSCEGEGPDPVEPRP
jgi:glycosyltransferase involved in cell wall biosynthesis